MEHLYSDILTAKHRLGQDHVPKGPKGEKRPADVVGNAVKIMRIAIGDEQELGAVDDGKDPAAKALGKKGGAARAKKLSAKRRSEIAKKAAMARYSKKGNSQK